MAAISTVHRLVTVSAVKQTKWLLCVHTPDIKFQVNTAVTDESLNSSNATMSLYSAVLCQDTSWLRGKAFDSAVALHKCSYTWTIFSIQS